MPGELKSVTSVGEQAATHSLRVFALETGAPLIICELCGAWCSHRGLRLAKICRRHANRGGKFAIKRVFSQGVHPHPNYRDHIAGEITEFAGMQDIALKAVAIAAKRRGCTAASTAVGHNTSRVVAATLQQANATGPCTVKRRRICCKGPPPEVAACRGAKRAGADDMGAVGLTASGKRRRFVGKGPPPAAWTALAPGGKRIAEETYAERKRPHYAAPRGLAAARGLLTPVDLVSAGDSA